MADASRTFGLGGSIEFEGKRYALHPLRLEDLASFEMWMEDQAFKRVQRHRGKVSARDYAERLDAVAKLSAANFFSYSGDAADAVTRTEDGQRFLTFLMLADNPGMDEDLAARIFDGCFAELQALAGSHAEQADPNPEAPAA